MQQETNTEPNLSFTTDKLTNSIAVNSLKYLHNVSCLLNDYDDVNILKFHYSQNFTKIQIQNGISLPEKTGNGRAKCPKCCTMRSSLYTTFKIDPVPRRNRFVQKMLRKVENGKRVTNYQRKFIDKMPNDCNKLIISCKLCNHEVKDNLAKHKKVVPLEILNNKKIIKQSLKDAKSKKKLTLSQRNILKAKKLKNSIKLTALLNTKHKRKSESLRDFLKMIP